MAQSYLSTPFHPQPSGSPSSPTFWSSLGSAYINLGSFRKLTFSRISDGSPTYPPEERIRPHSPSSPSTSSPFPLYAHTVSPSYGRKKKSYRFGPRDSLNSRYRIGRPGSRRYRRWHNEYHLIELLSETESASDVDLDDLEYDETREPSPGYFAFVFEESHLPLLEPYLDTTEDRENRLLGATITSPSRTVRHLAASADLAFRSMSTRAQRVLKRFVHRVRSFSQSQTSSQPCVTPN